jgi:hypothetical protein
MYCASHLATDDYGNLATPFRYTSVDSSRSNFHWASIPSPLFPETGCLQTIIDQYTSWQDTTLHGLIDDFISAEANIQQVTNSA